MQPREPINEERERKEEQDIHHLCFTAELFFLLMTTPTQPPSAAMRNEDAQWQQRENERNPGPSSLAIRAEPINNVLTLPPSPIRAQPFFPIFSRLLPFHPPSHPKVGGSQWASPTNAQWVATRAQSQPITKNPPFLTPSLGTSHFICISSIPPYPFYYDTMRAQPAEPRPQRMGKPIKQPPRSFFCSTLVSVVTTKRSNEIKTGSVA